MARSWEAGSTRAWRHLRARVLLLNQQRNGGRCTLALDGATACPRHGQACRRDDGGRICTGTATHAHHSRGRSVTGDDPRYVVATCGPCNLHVGDPATWAAPVDAPARPATRWETW